MQRRPRTCSVAPCLVIVVLIGFCLNRAETFTTDRTPRKFSCSDCLDPQYRCTRVTEDIQRCAEWCRLYLGYVLLVDKTTSETHCFCIERISIILQVITTTSYRLENSHVTGTDDTGNEVTPRETSTADSLCTALYTTYRSKDTTTTIPLPTTTPENNIAITTATTIPPPTTTSVFETTPFGNPCNYWIDIYPAVNISCNHLCQAFYFSNGTRQDAIRCCCRNDATTTTHQPPTATVTDAMSTRKSETDCYEDWSRCSPVTIWLNGILWKKCNDRCIELGYSRGDCVPWPSDCWWLPNNERCICS